MSFAYFSRLGSTPGRRDELAALLSRANSGLTDAGCLRYDVGVDGNADAVLVSELWSSAEAHDASLRLESTRAAIATAAPLLSGDNRSWGYEVLGSPLPS